MTQSLSTTELQQAPGPRALRILAKSVYRELKAAGYERGDIVGFANELLDVLSSEIRDSSQPPT